MQTETNGNSESTVAKKSAIKPAIFADTEDIREYAVSLRHLMVGLADQSSFAALVCPAGADADSVLCPSVELICHPLFRIPVVFKKQNQQEVVDKLSKFKPTVLHCFSRSKAEITKYVAEQLSLPYVLTFNSMGKFFSRSFVTDPGCACLISSSDIVSKKIARVYPDVKCNVEQVNVGAFVTDQCACFSNMSRAVSMVIAQDLKRPAEFRSFLNAIRHLAIDGYEFMLAIIGTGPASNKIRAMIKTLGLSNMVTLIEEIKPLRSVFGGADIFIQLDVDNFPNSQLLEAMSVGMAVASSKDNKSHLLVDGQTASLFDPHDELSIYSTLKKLLSTREFARQIAVNSQQHIRQEHSVSTMADKLIGIYQEAQTWLKTSKAPPSAPLKAPPAEPKDAETEAE